MDQTACQNVSNVTRNLYLPGQENKINKNPIKFKTNATGFQSINCKSYLEFHKTNNAMDFIKILIKFRILNSENKNYKKELENILNNPNISDEEIKKYLEQKGLTFQNFREKINDKLYDDSSKQKSLETIEKICKKENRNNKRKIEYYKRKNLLLNINTEEIIEHFKKEKKINIVLDNYRVHHSKIVEKVCQILNINLIFLPPYSPDLNPIEDLWRVIKKEMYNNFFDSIENMKKLFKKEFDKNIIRKSFYENWIKKYIN